MQSARWCGSSPRERGAPQDTGLIDGRGGLIPARAGSTQTWRRWVRRRPAHPRASGEHHVVLGRGAVVVGSSPRERGAHTSARLPVRQGGLIPARAGSTTSRTSSPTPWGAHPRASGEHKWLMTTPSGVKGSSPRERGAPDPSGREVAVVGLIPARAGSTARWWSGSRRGRAHPRASGEHDGAADDDRVCGGSSPRERGAPSIVLRSSRSSGLIPARAGSTRRGRR